MAEDIQEVRDKIDGMHNRLDEASYYELLDVDPEWDDNEISKKATDSFRQLAKQWHVDRYDIDALGGQEYRQKLQEIFSTINTAHQVLTDDEKRTEYDMERSGENTDVGAILTAENAFKKGRNMLSRGSYDGAHRQFEIAVENNPDDIEYQGHLLYTRFLRLPKDEEGIPKNRSDAKQIYDELDGCVDEKPENDSLLAYLGVVAMGLKRYREAKALFQESLQYNRSNTTAQRQKRLLEMRRKREQNKGFFAKLLDKFS